MYMDAYPRVGTRLGHYGIYMHIHAYTWEKRGLQYVYV